MSPSATAVTATTHSRGGDLNHRSGRGPGLHLLVRVRWEGIL